jgi:hypothetical protein
VAREFSLFRVLVDETRRCHKLAPSVRPSAGVLRVMGMLRRLRPAVTVGDSVATVYFTPTILELTLNS